MVAANTAIVTRTATESESLTVEEEIVIKRGTLTVAIVETGVIAVAQHHHGAVDATHLTTGVAEVTQEVPPEVVALRVGEVGITKSLPQPTHRPRL